MNFSNFVKYFLSEIVGSQKKANEFFMKLDKLLHLFSYLNIAAKVKKKLLNSRQQCELSV